MFKLSHIFGVFAIGMTAIEISASVYFVDNIKGNDANDGAEGFPFKTIAQGLSVLKGGDTLKLVPNPTPYCEKIEMKEAKYGGTLEQPTVIDGQGATIDRRTRRPADQWKSEGDDIFSMTLKNNAWVMDKRGHWYGFPIVFFDDKPAPFRENREALTPLSYFLAKYAPEKGNPRSPEHNTLYIKLPAGKTPDDVKVVTVGMKPTVYVNAKNVTVRNLSVKYSTHDGFSTSRGGENAHFENVHSSYNMDQGISNHGTQGVVVRNSRFDHNAGGGIVDVYPTCRVTYERCVVEDTVFRNAVEFYRGQYKMVDCVIRGNSKVSLIVGKASKVELVNCLLIGDGQTNGVNLDAGCELRMTNCTLYRYKNAFHIAPRKPEAILGVSHCSILDCPIIFYWRQGKDVVSPKLVLSDNFYTPGVMTGMGEFTADTVGKFNEAFGKVQKSTMKSLKIKLRNGVPDVEGIPELKERCAVGLDKLESK